MKVDESLKRKHSICIKLNAKEYKVLEKYFSKYKVKNRSKFIRELILKYVIEHLVEKDYPSLFESFKYLVDETQEQTYTETDDENSTGEQDDTDIEELPYPKLF